MLASAAWGLLANVLIYVPLMVLLLLTPETGHLRAGARPRRPLAFGLGEMVALLGEAHAQRPLMTMILLGAATAFFVGNAFQAQMPEYAHAFGTDEAGAWYSILLAGNAAGALLGAILLETVPALRPTTRAAILFAGGWALAMGLFPLASGYPVAVALLVLAGMFNIAFTSMAQTLVQILAPPDARGRMVGLFNTAILGLRAGSGITIGVIGAVIGVHWSLILSAAVVVAITSALLVRETRSRRSSA